MAYRFLLEVPAIYEQEANAAVAAVPDAQVVVSRKSHGLGFDQPYANLTVAAHSLEVIPVLYGFANDIGATRPDSRAIIGIVLHDGRRVGFHELPVHQLVGEIRRDQPWVEHTMPKIGEHEPTEFTRYRRQQRSSAALAVSDDTTETAVVKSVIVERMQDVFNWEGEDYALVPVSSLHKAESFYTEVLGLQVIERLSRDDLGNWREQEPAETWSEYEVDRVLLEHGSLDLALERVGAGARLDYARVSTHFSLLVDPDVLARIRATVLVRGYDVLEDVSGDFTFRDPFGVAWSVTDHADNQDRW